jgi:hypothetical protein
MKTNLKLTLFILFYFFSAVVYSQKYQDFPVNSSIAFKLNSTSLIDNLSFPTFEIAVEKRFSSFYGLQLETGIQLYEFSENNVDTSNVNLSGYRFRIEGRRYLNTITTRTNNNSVFGKVTFFTGISFLYRNNTYDYNLITNTNRNGNFEEINDNIGVKKRASSLNTLFGGQISIINDIYIEPTLYIGFINRKIQNIDRQTPNQGDFIGKVASREYAHLEESSGASLNFSFSIRLGIKL